MLWVRIENVYILDLNLRIQRIHYQYIQNCFFPELDQLDTYRLFKTRFCYEAYLSNINNYILPV